MSMREGVRRPQGCAHVGFSVASLRVGILPTGALHSTGTDPGPGREGPGGAPPSPWLRSANQRGASAVETEWLPRRVRAMFHPWPRHRLFVMVEEKEATRACPAP